MWSLLNEDGTVFRSGCDTQWEAVISCTKKDGSRFKKAEALELESGTPVYKILYATKMVESHSLMADGTLGEAYMQKKQYATQTKFTLVRN